MKRWTRVAFHHLHEGGGEEPHPDYEHGQRRQGDVLAEVQVRHVPLVRPAPDDLLEEVQHVGGGHHGADPGEEPGGLALGEGADQHVQLAHEAVGPGEGEGGAGKEAEEPHVGGQDFPSPALSKIWRLWVRS